MKTLLAEEKFNGRRVEVTAKTTYETASGQWIAEIDGTEFRRVCQDLCGGIEGCTCADLHIEADQDDDGKEYTILSS